MINQLVLQNFKRHQSLVINFSAGLVALRGANEVGKSTIYQAIGYALGGARALPMSLEETVTYDVPVSKLKVCLTFTFEGTQCVIERSKSGAKLTYGTTTANGQTEVTKFIEGLLGVNMDVGAKLMIASQGRLRGALESGDAVALIEKLANISLIDELVKKVQDQLPNGNTKAVEAALVSLSESTAPVLDVAALEAELSGFVATLEEVDKPAIKALEDQLAPLANPLQLNLAINACGRDRQEAAKTLSLIVNLKEKLKEEFDIKPMPSAAEVRNEIASRKSLEKAKQAYAEWRKVKQPTRFFDKPFKGTLLELNADKLVQRSLLKRLDIELAGLLAKKITETHCGLCGKDLENVPEVVAKNEVIDETLAELDMKATAAARALKAVESGIAVVNARVADEALTILAQARLSAYTELTDTVPKGLVWVGPEVDSTTDTSTVEMERQLAAIETQTRAYAQYLARRGEWSKQLEEAEGSMLSYDEEAINQVEAEARETLTKSNELRTKLASYKESIKPLVQSISDWRQEISTRNRVYASECAEYARSIATVELMERQLGEMQKNNALIRKLREVRPIVAARLWSVVLASVSTYFSQVRGEVSVITRSETGFLCNGKPVEGLSGSTLDSLGLAIRIALGKTFLPSVDWLLLDEPAAGMDDEREAAMLGLLSTVNYGQVVVVTHSSLADTFANSVIQL